MPRGVVIPEVRQQLFAALERLIVAEGLNGLTGRAVTREAGVATGLLHAHFRTWDGFLGQYAADRSFQVAGAVADLPGRAGAATVAENLAAAVGAVPLDVALPLARLLASRADLTSEVERVLGPGMAGLSALEPAVTRYLSAEVALGRTVVDPAAGALALVGVLHHLVLTGGDLARLREVVRV